MEAALAAVSEFEDLANWQRSRKGNLWRKWEGLTVTVFYRLRRYHWSIADEEGPRFSQGSYSGEAEAITALREALGVGE